MEAKQHDVHCTASTLRPSGLELGARSPIRQLCHSSPGALSDCKSTMCRSLVELVQLQAPMTNISFRSTYSSLAYRKGEPGLSSCHSQASPRCCLEHIKCSPNTGLNIPSFLPTRCLFIFFIFLPLVGLSNFFFVSKYAFLAASFRLSIY